MNKKIVIAIALILAIAVAVVVGVSVKSKSKPVEEDTTTTQLIETDTREIRPIDENSDFTAVVKHYALCAFQYDNNPYNLELEQDNRFFWQAVAGAVTENYERDPEFSLDKEYYEISRQEVGYYLEALYPNLGEYPPYPEDDLIFDIDENTIGIQPCYYGDWISAEVTEVTKDSNNVYKVKVTVFDYDGDAEFYYTVDVEAHPNDTTSNPFDYSILGIESE